jgi:hypothetical protein
MNKLFTKISLTLPALVLAMTALVAVPVLADDGGSSGSGGTTTSTSGSGDTSGSSTSGSNDTTETTTTDSTKTEIETQDRHQGALMLTELRHSGRHHTLAEVKTACEAHKQGLDTSFSHISLSLTSFNSRVAGILAKAEAYQKTNNITVANWDSLVAAATAAGTTSDASIAALKAVTPSLDCNSTSVAQDVATFKAAAVQARTDVKAYKAAVRAVVKALLDAKQASQGGQQ